MPYRSGARRKIAPEDVLELLAIEGRKDSGFRNLDRACYVSYSVIRAPCDFACRRLALPMDSVLVTTTIAICISDLHSSRFVVLSPQRSQRLFQVGHIAIHAINPSSSIILTRECHVPHFRSAHLFTSTPQTQRHGHRPPKLQPTRLMRLPPPLPPLPLPQQRHPRMPAKLHQMPKIHPLPTRPPPQNLGARLPARNIRARLGIIALVQVKDGEIVVVGVDAEGAARGFDVVMDELGAEGEEEGALAGARPDLEDLGEDWVVAEEGAGSLELEGADSLLDFGVHVRMVALVGLRWDACWERGRSLVCGGRTRL